MSAASTTTAASTAAAEKASAGGDARKRPRVAATRSGPALRADSAETKRLATAILEVLAGVRTPTDAAKSLDISVSRYYLLETRALAGLLAACEPCAKGSGRNADRELAKLQRELAASRRECARQQALLRAAQRAIGLAPPPAPKPTDKNGAKPARRRRPTARALRAARAIAVNSSGTNSPDGVQPSPSAGSDGSAAQPPTHLPPPSAAVDHGGSP
jgi:hypothetical protein